MAQKKAQQGWGFSKDQNAKLDITQKAERKVNIWEQNNENLIIIPDLEEEAKDNQVSIVSAPPSQAQVQVQDLNELQNITKKTTLPAVEGVDLSLLMTIMRPIEDIKENDEPWEFQKLKTEIYEIVNNMYRVNQDLEETN